MDQHLPSRTVWNSMWVLVWPVLIEQLLSMSVGYTDWWLAGHYLPGASYQAAMGLMSYMMWLIPSAFAAVAIGATALVARRIGAGQPERASNILVQAYWVGCGFALVATLAVIFGGATFVQWMQLSANAAPLAVRYLAIIGPVIPLVMLHRVGAACLRGAGDTVTGFLIQLIINIVNMFVSAVLVTGWGPFPEMGWEGLAIGTAFGHCTGGILLVLAVLRGRAGLRLQRRFLKPDSTVIRDLLRIGLPGGIDVGAILACHMVFLAIINSIGETAAAAHNLGVQIEALAYMPGAAFQVAATTLAGQFLGAKKPRAALHAILLCSLAAGIVMTIAGICFYFAGGWLTYFFVGDSTPESSRLTADLLKIVAWTMPSLAISLVVTGGLRGAGDTRWPLMFTLAGFIGLRIPLACWFAFDTVSIPWTDVVIEGFGSGVIGAWWAMLIDVVFRSMLALLRLWQGGWQKIDV